MDKKLFVVLSSVFLVFVFGSWSFAASCGCGGGIAQGSCSQSSAPVNGCGNVQNSCHSSASAVNTQQTSLSRDVAQVAVKDPVKVGNKICPVMGGKVDEKVTYEYEGKIYNFCCPGCVDVFKNDPQKYVQKVEEQLKSGS